MPRRSAEEDREPLRAAATYWRIENDLWAVLRIPAFNLYAASRVASSGASHLLQALILWQVYELSGSVVDLGVVGLVRLAPSIGMAFVSGAVADTYDMRRVLQAAQAVPLIGTLAMLVALALGVVSLPFIYLLVFVTASAMAFEAPARQVLLRALVPRMLFPRALTVNSTMQSLATTIGPALGGVLIATGGVTAAYVAHAVLMAAAMVAVFAIPPVAADSNRTGGVTLKSIVEGFSFVRRRPVLLGAMTLDLFAVIFGGATALLPVYALDILQVGATGYGLLSASLRAGGFVAALTLAVLPVPVRIGRALVLSVGMFGVATLFFGLSTWAPLSVLAYAVVGAADKVSVVMRLNTIQLGTPDALRGRVTAVSQVFVNGSEQLGAIESGFVAGVTNAVFAVVSGGVACLAVVGFIAWRIPELRTYQRPTASPHPR